MTEAPQFLAFVDESGSNQLLDPGTYILAAVVLEPEHAETARGAMVDLAAPGQKKLHWRDESTHRRMLIAKTIGELRLDHVIVVREDGRGDRLERQRRACLRRLVHELSSLGVDHVTFESRGSADDRRDRQALEAFRRSDAVTQKVRMHHRVGPSEPLLWLPDAVAGAMVGKRIGDDAPWNLIAAQCTVVTC